MKISFAVAIKISQAFNNKITKSKLGAVSCRAQFLHQPERGLEEHIFKYSGHHQETILPFLNPNVGRAPSLRHVNRTSVIERPNITERKNE